MKLTRKRLKEIIKEELNEAVKKQKIARELKNLDMGFGTSRLAPQQISRIMDLLYKYKLIN